MILRFTLDPASSFSYATTQPAPPAGWTLSQPGPRVIEFSYSVSLIPPDVPSATFNLVRTSNGTTTVRVDLIIDGTIVQTQTYYV